MSLDVITFGCRLNSVESAALKQKAQAAGLDAAIVVNTCAVTEEAVRQARQTIRRAHRADPKKPIIVTGCAAQADPALFAAMEEVTLVLGNAEKLKADSYRSLPDFGVSASEKIKVNDIMGMRESALHLIDGFEDRVRAFVEVQNGCDHRCTFCIIPFTRGPSRSVPMGEIVRQIRHLVEKGYREVVLTGVDLTAYGADLPGKPMLGALVRTILRHIPDLPRLRLSSLDQVEVDEALFRAFAEEERLMPHVHLSLQAGDDLILKRMKRRHLRRDAIAFCEKMRILRPDVVFGADLIAGFPTETEAHFQNSLAIVEECGLTYLHVFPYSPRPQTPAARMPPLAPALVKERAARLRTAGEEALSRYLMAEQGARRSVLVEKEGLGRTEHFAMTRVEGALPGAVLAVRITGHSGRVLTAVAA